MKIPRKLLWVAVPISVPVGGFIGYHVGYYAYMGILKFQGMGNSHDDMISLVIAGGLIAFIGAFSLPLFICLYIRKQKAEIQAQI